MIGDTAQPPGNAAARMDQEYVVAAAQAAMCAATTLLNLLQQQQEGAQGELEEIAQDLAAALDAVIGFMPERDEDANQLLGALQRWLP